MGNGTFTLTKSYADDKFWTEEIMDVVKSELEAQINTVFKNNFNQLKADLLPSTYTYDDDGAANLSNPLYNKQTATNTYSANVSLGTTANASFADMDATNLQLTFTPELTGKYLVRMTCPVQVVPTAGTQLDYQCHFRITDSGTSPQVSQPTTVIVQPRANDSQSAFNVVAESIMTFTANESQIIRFQKRIITATNLATHVMLGSTGLYGFQAMAIKI